MGFSIELEVDVLLYLHDNKDELSLELNEKFVKNINQRKDFPTGFYLTSFDTKLDSKMMQHIATLIGERYVLNAEEALLMVENPLIKDMIKEIIRESYE